MRKTFRRLLALPLLLVLAAPAWGQADLSRYVAIGDSLGAGVASGGMVEEVQIHSYPAQIYRAANGSLDGFEIPTVSTPGLGPLLQLVGLSPLIIVPADGFGQPTNLFLPRPYNNLAVPGADVADVVSTVNGGAHDLVLRGIGTQLEQAIFLQPSFVSVWIGGNDVLGAAVSGIVLDGFTVTPTAVFEDNYRAMAGALAQFTSAQMAFGTVPDVTSIPFVTTIPPILLDPATNEPILVNGQLVPLIGPHGPMVLGQDFVLLSAAAELRIGRGLPPQLGGTGPLSDSATLTRDEVAVLVQRVDEYNQVIQTIASEVGAAVADMNGLLLDLAANGFELGGIEYSTDFVTGGLISLDGVHPLPMGYAVAANRWIDAINEHFGADIPPVDYLPFMFGEWASAGTGYPVNLGGGRPLFTPKADRALRALLNIPSKQRLERIKARREAQGKD